MMRTLRALLCGALVASGFLSMAQSPVGFKYQAVLRDAFGNPMPSQSVDVQIAVLGTAPGNPAIYTETHSVTTNEHGLFTLEMGRGVSSDDSDTLLCPICFSSFEVSLDIGNTGVFTSMGTEEFLSVPFALHAGSSGDVPEGTEVGQVMHWDGEAWVSDTGLYVLDRRLGIGTTEPGAPLGVVVDSFGTALRLLLSDQPGNDQGWEFGRVHEPGDAHFGAITFSESASGVSIPRLTIADSTGYVGIGTIVPEAPLEIAADSSNGSAIILRRGITASKSFTNWVVLSHRGTTPDGLLITDSLSEPGRIFFIADSTGRVGIGTEDPPAALSITSRDRLKTYFETGDIPTESNFGITTDSTGFGIGQGAPDALVSRLFIADSTGNVGIGTDAPTRKLEVADLNHDGRLDLALRNTASVGNQGWAMGHIHDQSVSERDGTFSLLEHTDLGPEERLHVLPVTGNVGIGPPVASAKLHVSRPASDPDAVVSLAEGTGIAVFGPITDNVAFDHQGIQARHGEYIGPTLDLQTATLNVQRLGGDVLIHGGSPDPLEQVAITSDGRLGIGTTTPTAPVTVASRELQYASYKHPTGAGGDMYMEALPTGGLSFGEDTVGGVARSLVIGPGLGYVGIGTATPAERLHVHGALVVGGSTSFSPPDGTFRYRSGQFEGKAEGHWVQLSGPFKRTSTNVAYFDTLSGPRVGIGDSAPQAALHVKAKSLNASVPFEAEAVRIENTASSAGPG
ncbi:MAG: hypothetical protein KDB88_12065, partial [Flavobacteriales bacterium]|nr:hypothetical protein [Flavobacteriales bacterium]